MMPVEGHKDLVRDEKTNAIISVDKTGYETYMINRRINYDKQAEIDAMISELETLKSMLNDLASKITS